MKTETLLYRKEIGKRIKKLRTDIYETQEVFSENIGIAKQTLVNLENGLGSLKLEYLYQIASYCKCDVGFLLGEYEERTYKAKYICDMTGLNEEAADFLISINKDKMIADSFLNNPRFEKDEYFKIIKRDSEIFLNVLNSLLNKKSPLLLKIFELLSFNGQKKEIECSNWYDSLKDYSGYSVEEVIDILKYEGLSNEEIEKTELTTNNFFGIIYGLDEQQNYKKYQAYKEFINFIDELVI